MSTLERSVVSSKSLPRVSIGNYLLKYGVLVAFLMVLLLSAIAYPGFMRPENLLNVLGQMAIVGIMAIGMTYVMITGGFDLSVGGIYAFSAVLMGGMIGKMPLAVAILLTVLVGCLMGLVNGFVITKLKVNPFVTTLGMGSILTGFALLYTDSKPIFIKNEAFSWIGQGDILSVPVSGIILILGLILSGIILAYSTYGRSLYAIGGNNEASWLSGLRTDRIRTSAYIVCGLCSSISGIIITSRLSVAQANIGGTISLDVIAAVVIGGTSLSGGEGSIWRTAVGLSILAIMSNVFDSLSLSPYWQSIIKGLIIILAVAYDYYARAKIEHA